MQLRQGACTRHPGTETTCTYHYLPSDMSSATVAPSTAARAVFSVNSSSQPRCGGYPPLRQRRIHWKQQETAALPAWLHSRLVASPMHTSNVRYAQPLRQQLAYVERMICLPSMEKVDPPHSQQHTMTSSPAHTPHAMYSTCCQVNPITLQLCLTSAHMAGATPKGSCHTGVSHTAAAATQPLT